ncbi:hypothetical protein RvY_14652 [Ramazzottius varieornatus]|uniref:Uncharacterized protein n=1 Tax=Ramazzottius varieornatus TaxID=947166 RepID=A0A1D1VZB1_RAMVA|nr:hypothetical protein RvY_14652 [Ramazzottius varieornatus]
MSVGSVYQKDCQNQTVNSRNIFHQGSGDWVELSGNQDVFSRTPNITANISGFSTYELGSSESTPRKSLPAIFDEVNGTPHSDTTGDSKSLFPSSLPIQYKALVSQIETSRQPNYPFILRRVYEAGHLKAFLQYLDRRSEAQDVETEQICAEHTATLTKTAKDIMSISQGVESIHSGLKSIGKVQAQELEGAHNAAKLVETYGNALIHTATLMERISILKPVVRIVGEAQICIEKDQLVRALRKLHDAWERVRTLPHHIRLVKSLADNIPFMKDQIIAQAKRGVTISLESMRSVNLRVGYLTLKTICETHRINVAPYFVDKAELLRSYPEEVKYLEDKSWSVDHAIKIKHLLVYRHIMLTFEPKDLSETELKSYCENYELQRKHQAGQMMQSPNSMRSVEDIRRYIQEIIGIFALELHVNKTITGLTSPDFLSALWSETAPVVTTTLRSSFPLLTDEERCRRVRDLISLLSTTMESLHCDTSQITVVLDNIRDHYGEILLRGLVDQMNRVLESDALIAVSITSREEEERFLCGFPFRLDEVQDNQMLPKHFPFSTSVPKIYTLMKDYVASFLQFSREGSLGQAEVDDKVRTSILNLLSQKLRACIGGVVERGTLNIEQLVQLYINCKYLEFSCQYLEVFLIDLLKLSSAAFPRPGSSQSEPSEKIRTGSSAFPTLFDHSSIFRDIRSQIEQQIYASLKYALEVMMDETRFDSAAAEVSDKPSELWHRIIRYLEPVFDSVRKLPYNVCQTAWMTACKQIAGELEHSFAKKSTMVTIEGTQQLKNDLSAYEDFLTKQAAYTDVSMLLLAFTSLNHLTDLLLLWDWNTYFHEYGRKDAKYDRVQPQLVLQILHKMKETDRKKSSVFQNLRKNERDKKKLLDNIIVQLKELLNERTS